MTIVALTANQDIAHSIDEALGLLDLGFLRSKRVAVKPNETWAGANGYGTIPSHIIGAIVRGNPSSAI